MVELEELKKAVSMMQKACIGAVNVSKVMKGAAYNLDIDAAFEAMTEATRMIDVSNKKQRIAAQNIMADIMLCMFNFAQAHKLDLAGALSAHIERIRTIQYKTKLEG